MKNNFSLDLIKLDKVPSTRRTDRIGQEKGYTFALYNRKAPHLKFHYANDLQDLAEFAINIINHLPNKLFTFFEDYDVLFSSGFPVHWQKRHRITFANMVYKAFVDAEMNRIIQLGKDKNPYKNDDPNDLNEKPITYWTSKNIEEFIESKNINTEKGLFRFPYICAVTIEIESHVDKIYDYFLNQFDMQDITFSESHFAPGPYHPHCTAFIGFANEDQANYMHLTAPFEFKMLGAIDFTEILKTIKDVQLVIENKFLKS